MTLDASPAERGMPMPERFRNTDDPYKPRRPMQSIPIAPEEGAYGDMERAAGEEPKRNRLNEIAELVRSLTYGEMMDLAGAIWEVKPGEELTESTLAPTLHLWSTVNL